MSPHCDAARKRATHIFHFNDEKDWDQAWGGETLILAADRPIATYSGRTFYEGGRGTWAAGNRSMLFQRTPHSWHGMKPLTCPPGKLRQIFSVTLNIPTVQECGGGRCAGRIRTDSG